MNRSLTKISSLSLYFPLKYFPKISRYSNKPQSNIASSLSLLNASTSISCGKPSNISQEGLSVLFCFTIWVINSFRLVKYSCKVFLS